MRGYTQLVTCPRPATYVLGSSGQRELDYHLGRANNSTPFELMASIGIRIDDVSTEPKEGDIFRCLWGLYAFPIMLKSRNRACSCLMRPTIPPGRTQALLSSAAAGIDDDP